MRIAGLILYTDKLEELRRFYGVTLGISELPGEKAVFVFGRTRVKWVHTPQATRYHFAINIPANKAPEALEWLRRRVTLLKFEGEEMIDFKNWNAESMYFYDPAGNIVELIARKGLDNAASAPFDSSQVLCISEIGVATENIEHTFRQLRGLGPLEVFDGSFDKFCAAGDDEGLFIIVDRVKKKWFPTDDVILPADFEMHGDFNFRFTGGEVIPL